MYSILISPSNTIPFIISQNTLEYVEYMDSGYEQIATGTLREMNAIFDECIMAYSN